MDEYGNSVRGVEVCKEVSRRFGLHVFASGTNQQSIIRREFRADVIRSKRLRTPTHLQALLKQVKRIVVVELHGSIFFSSAEQLIRRLTTLAEEADWLILDFSRTHVVEAFGVTIFKETLEALTLDDCKVALVFIPDMSKTLMSSFSDIEKSDKISFFDDRDDALETFENELLAERPELEDQTRFAFREMQIFADLPNSDYEILEREAQVFSFEPGETVIREDDKAVLFYVIARGSVSVQISLPDGRQKRVASVGPGLPVGEMALIDGGTRSADVIADETVICYGFSVDRLQEAASGSATLISTIMVNLARSLSERLRSANEEIRSLH